MNDPLPLQDVLEIVERRRRRRVAVRSVAGSALAVAGVGAVGLVVAVLQSGASAPSPAGPAPSLSSPGRLPVSAAPPPPFDPAVLRSDYLTGLAGQLFAVGPEAQAQKRLNDAGVMAVAWDIGLYPESKAVIAKADLARIAIDPADPNGDDELVGRFESAGYTDADAAELAAAWGTDVRTAKVFGGLIVEGR